MALTLTLIKKLTDIIVHFAISAALSAPTPLFRFVAISFTVVTIKVCVMKISYITVR